jgi:Cys-rich protein (TIGR01571 family)
MSSSDGSATGDEVKSGSETAPDPAAVVPDLDRLQPRHVGEPEWSSGLFDCFKDCATCMKGWYCCGCLLAENEAYIQDKEPWSEENKWKTCGVGTGMCIVSYLFFFTGACISCSWALKQTRSIQNGYDIPMGDKKDCAMTVFLPWCQLCRISRELKLRRVLGKE